MATVPCTLVVLTQDPLNFPAKTAFLVMKQLFNFGVRNLKREGDKIFISLSYSPTRKLLIKKFGTLPISYMRTQLDSLEQFKELTKVVKRYRFNLLDEDLDENNQILGVGKKRRLGMPSLPFSTVTSSSVSSKIHEVTIDDDGDDDDNNANEKNDNKLLNVDEEKDQREAEAEEEEEEEDEGEEGEEEEEEEGEEEQEEEEENEMIQPSTSKKNVSKCHNKKK